MFVLQKTLCTFCSLARMLSVCRLNYHLARMASHGSQLGILLSKCGTDHGNLQLNCVGRLTLSNFVITQFSVLANIQIRPTLSNLANAPDRYQISDFLHASFLHAQTHVKRQRKVISKVAHVTSMKLSIIACVVFTCVAHVNDFFLTCCKCELTQKPNSYP